MSSIGPPYLKPKDEGKAATQEKILGCLRTEPTLTRKLLAQRFNISEDGIKYHLNKLKATNKIRHVGPTKAVGGK